MHEACGNGSREIVELLLDYGFDINSPNSLKAFFLMIFF